MNVLVQKNGNVETVLTKMINGRVATNTNCSGICFNIKK